MNDVKKYWPDFKYSFNYGNINSIGICPTRVPKQITDKDKNKRKFI